MDPLPTHRAGASVKDWGSPSARKHLLEVLPAPQSRQNRPRTAPRETRTFQLPPLPSPAVTSYLPVAAVHNKLPQTGCLETTKICSLPSGGQKSKISFKGAEIKGRAGLCSLWGLRKESTPHLSQLLVTAGNLQDLLGSPCLLFCVWQSSLGFSYKDTCHCF